MDKIYILYMSIHSDDPTWDIDFVKFREYLKKKYNVSIAYFFLVLLLMREMDYMTKFKELDLF
jgi:hypothetical protein